MSNTCRSGLHTWGSKYRHTYYARVDVSTYCRQITWQTLGKHNLNANSIATHNHIVANRTVIIVTLSMFVPYTHTCGNNSPLTVGRLPRCHQGSEGGHRETQGGGECGWQGWDWLPPTPHYHCHSPHLLSSWGEWSWLLQSPTKICISLQINV